jgi:hypothetical protein
MSPLTVIATISMPLRVARTDSCDCYSRGEDSAWLEGRRSWRVLPPAFRLDFGQSARRGAELGRDRRGHSIEFSYSRDRVLPRPDPDFSGTSQGNWTKVKLQGTVSRPEHALTGTRPVNPSDRNLAKS